MPRVALSCTSEVLARGPDRIRLLRLRPHSNNGAPIECELLDVLFEERGGLSYPYEALSYVWGDLADTQPITMDGHPLDVTRQLHEALSHLRYRHYERILWIDAVCIDQNNKQEKERQIQLMPRIYNQAKSVIVWLGKEADNSTKALEAIVRAGRDKTHRFSNEVEVRQAVTQLLQRPWFRRIWVLQEVAAARHIQIKCGHMEVDGYAFCLGADSLRPFYEACTDLQNRIRSMTYLIRGAIFRLGRTTSLDTGPERVCPLGELIDRYHTHEATELYDKVYALLGMSSEDPGEAGLFPSYQEPWQNVLRRVTKFAVSDKISVDARPEKEAVILRSKGWILGRVSSVDKNVDWDNRQSLNVFWKDISLPTERVQENINEISARWTIQDSAKSVQEGDVICLLEGSTRPTIIRLQEDFSVVIVIAAHSPHTLPRGSGQRIWSLFLKLPKSYIRDFTLVWDWDNNPEKFNNSIQLEQWMQKNGWNSGNDRHESEGDLEKANRCWTLGLMLGDVKMYEAAEVCFIQAMMNYETVLKEHDVGSPKSQQITDAAKAFLLFKGEGDRLSMHSRNGWTPLFYAIKQGYDRLFSLLLQTGEVDVNLRDKKGQTLLSWTAEKGNIAIVTELLRNDADVNAKAAKWYGKTALQAAAEAGHLDIVELLLEENANPNASGGMDGKTALQAAAGRGRVRIVKLLLDEEAYVNAEPSEGGIGRTALQAAAEGGHFEVVQQLLEANAHVNAPAGGEYRGRTALQAAAGGGHFDVVEQLLDANAKVNAPAATRWTGRTALQAAAEGGHLRVVRRLLDKKADVNAAAARYDGRTALQAAAEGGYLDVVECLLEAQANVNAPASVGGHGRTALEGAEANGHAHIVERLRRAGAID